MLTCSTMYNTCDAWSELCAMFLLIQGMRVFREFTPETWIPGLGRLKTFNFSNPQEDATDLKIEGGSLDVDTFNPHGISVFSDNATGNILCYKMVTILSPNFTQLFNIQAFGYTYFYRQSLCVCCQPWLSASHD